MSSSEKRLYHKTPNLPKDNKKTVGPPEKYFPTV